MKNLTLLISLMISAAPVVSALTDTMTGTFNDHIRTLRVEHSSGDLFAPPVVTMAGGDYLIVSFDHLSDDREFLRWRAVRCDANWQPSTLAQPEWIDSFNESAIEAYDYSSAVTVPYVHYEFAFPNDDIMPLLSGNYLIQVYPENDPDDAINLILVR